MNNLKKVLLALTICTAPLAQAEGYAAPSLVTEIQFYQGHQGILIQLASMVDPDSCGRNDWYILPDTYFRFKEAYGTLLAMKLSKQRVLLTVSGCVQGLPQIKHIELVQD